jgi:bifunctional ADP-heptose synthase (sugar kinase/adenylyltransferase)
MKSVTVVGDLILDRYLIGDATKLNSEQHPDAQKKRPLDSTVGRPPGVTSIVANT